MSMQLSPRSWSRRLAGLPNFVRLSSRNPSARNSGAGSGNHLNTSRRMWRGPVRTPARLSERRDPAKALGVVATNDASSQD